MIYHVYIWRAITSQAAEVCAEVQAPSADAALQAVMHAYQVPYASYAWIVPDDEDLPASDRYRVRCASARAAGH